MRLAELNARWLTPNVLAFRCPHCQQVLLTCKNVVMSEQEQHDLYEKTFGVDWNELVVPCKPEFCWTFSSTDLETLTISPSIDASRSGHWHGSVTRGDAS